MHVITGELRKEPRTKQMQNGTLYIVELSESFKNRDGEREYTNYTFFFNDGGKQGLQSWYAEAFQLGRVISVSCEQLKIELREHNGTTYKSLQAADFPKLIFSQRSGGAPQGQQSAPQQQQAPRQPQPQKDFDDDIPF